MKVNLPRSKSTISNGISKEKDKYIKLANDIRQRSESRRKVSKKNSLFERVALTKPIYAKDQLDFIRINYCSPDKAHETSHFKVYGNMNQSVQIEPKKLLASNYTSCSIDFKNTHHKENSVIESGSMTTKINRPNVSRLNLSTCEPKYKRPRRIFKNIKNKPLI